MRCEKIFSFPPVYMLLLSQADTAQSTTNTLTFQPTPTFSLYIWENHKDNSVLSWWFKISISLLLLSGTEDTYLYNYAMTKERWKFSFGNWRRDVFCNQIVVEYYSCSWHLTPYPLRAFQTNSQSCGITLLINVTGLLVLADLEISHCL